MGNSLSTTYFSRKNTAQKTVEPLTQLYRIGRKLRQINSIPTHMNPIHNCIEEQRWAMLEMRMLLNQVQNTYGTNPPAEILLAIAQIAKANRTKSTPHARKLNHTVGIEEFCTKNNLSIG